MRSIRGRGFLLLVMPPRHEVQTVALRDADVYLFVCMCVRLSVRSLPETRTQKRGIRELWSLLTTNNKWLFKEAILRFLDTYDDLERQQTSPRAQQQTSVKNFTPVKFMLRRGLRVVHIRATLVLCIFVALSCARRARHAYRRSVCLSVRPSVCP